MSQRLRTKRLEIRGLSQLATSCKFDGFVINLSLNWYWINKPFSHSEIMETSSAARALTMLGKDTRLRLLRLVMAEGASGMAAGDIAFLLAIPPSTLSSHLRALESIGLMRATRIGRSIYYAVHIEAMRQLFAFMTETCCGNEPERCGTLVALQPPRKAACGSESAACCAAEPGTIYNVLFLCVRNSARSIMAEAILNKVGKGRFRAFSGGTMPSPTGPRPEVLATLRSLNHDTTDLRSKDCSEFSAPGAPEIHFIIQLCEAPVAGVCAELGISPVTAAWPLPDPAKFRGRALERQVLLNELYGALLRRISMFSSLPIASLDCMTLTRQLNGIGSAMPQAAE